MKIETGKKYLSPGGETIVAQSDQRDAAGAAAFIDSDGLWLCLDPEACGLSEVVEIPEQWINAYPSHVSGGYVGRRIADRNANDGRIGVWHLKSDGTGEFIPTTGSDQ